MDFQAEINTREREVASLKTLLISPILNQDAINALRIQIGGLESNIASLRIQLIGIIHIST